MLYVTAGLNEYMIEKPFNFKADFEKKIIDLGHNIVIDVREIVRNRLLFNVSADQSDEINFKCNLEVWFKRMSESCDEKYEICPHCKHYLMPDKCKGCEKIIYYPCKTCKFVKYEKIFEGE